MSQPVKLSDALVLDARVAGAAVERSIAGQVEFWARIGKSVEGLLTGQQMRVMGRETQSKHVAKMLDDVDSPAGRKRVKDYLQSTPYPHYSAHPDGKGLLIREDESGSRTAGRFVNRVFVTAKRSRRSTAA